MKRLAAALLLLPGAAYAEDRDYCPARPGLDTPPCTIAPGHVSVEVGLADWTRADTAASRNDTILIGDILVRVGLTDSIEAEVGLTSFGRSRTRDKSSGGIDSADRAGDALLGLKANLHHPDGSGFSVAVEPFVTIPVGRPPIGAGDWGAGVLVPLSVDLGHKLSLQFTPEADAAVNQDGAGRHFAVSGTVGLGVGISDTVNGTIEFQELRDEDPSGRTMQSLASVSVAWMRRGDWQFDIGTAVGLNRDAPDAELYAGVSHRF
ncbi:MAG: transporter [Candidatus Sphingomonas phytovorans]|nr:transporter [Sphingomonas sp.]WEK01900.1 MAG: transporter [Sphingomonas sp.]